MKQLFLICCALLMIQQANAQTLYHVSPSGNDTHAGNESRPIKTLSVAVSRAAKQKGQSVVILLHGGTYYLEKEITLNAENMACKSLQISAFNGEKVFISAGQPLSLKWKPYKNGIFSATVPAGISFERLYVNGQLQVLARYPNYDTSAKVFHGTAANAVERAAKWEHPENGYVHAIHASEWGGFHYRITGMKDGQPVLEGGWQNNRPNKMHATLRFVENNLQELDTIGEWYLDSKARLLYYYPPAGLSPADARIEVSRLKNSIILKGTPTQPVRNVSLKGLRFVHNERSFMDTKEQLLRSDWTIYRGGAVLFDGTENCSISNCEFAGLGGNAIMLSNYNYHDTIRECYIHDIGASAVCFIGDLKAVRSPNFRYEEFTLYDQLDKTSGPRSNNYPRECLVTNSLIHHVGEIEKQATGVEITVSSGITVSHNSIYHTPRAGLNIGDGCFGGHVLEYNDVFNTVLETGDHGAFNSWGRDRYWAPDRGYMDSITAAHPELVKLDAIRPVIIRNNRFRCDHGWDIDLDDGSSNYRIYNNVCLNGGLKLREGFNRVVKNNIMINNSFHPHVWFANSQDVFENNIVMRKYFPIQVKDWGQQVDNNLFPDEAALELARSNGTDAHSIAGDPQFLHPEKGDYTVSPNSPALNIGFKNFAMDSFGVQEPGLKALALQPVIPALVMDKSQQTLKPAGLPFLGGMIKPVESMEERSAYGLQDESGAIIVSVPENSLLAASGIRPKDVICTANGIKVASAKHLLEILEAAKGKEKIPVEIMRNQQKQVLQVRVK